MKNGEPEKTKDNIFPIDAMFNHWGALHYGQIVHVYGVEEKDNSTIYVAKLSSGSADHFSIKCNVKDIFQECAAARREGRIADLTKFETPRP